jgi:23S rRNA pseudouridine2605 synthase
VPERIHKVLANAGIGSRRSIERWVAEGRITVDGRVAKLGEQLQGRERVCFDGKPIRLTAAKLARPPSDFIAYYKPGATRGADEDKSALALPRPRQGRWIDVSPHEPDPADRPGGRPGHRRKGRNHRIQHWER